MKKNTILLIVISLIGLFIIGGITFSVTSSNKGETVTYYSPDFVQMDCTLIQSDVDSAIGDLEYEGSGVFGNGDLSPSNPEGNKYTKISCNQFTDKCEIFLTKNQAWYDSQNFACPQGFDVFKCDEGATNCQRISGDTGDIVGGFYKVTELQPNQEFYIRTVNTGGLLCKDSTEVPPNSAVITERHDMYGLVVQGDTRLTKKRGDCIIPNDVKPNIVKRIDGKVNGEPSVYDIAPTELTFRQIGDGISYISYINEYNPISRDSVYNYNGKEVYCQGDGRLWEFGELETVTGTERKLAPTKLLTQVECCPYMEGCTSNFEWVPEEPSDCFSDMQCRGGIFYISENEQVSRQECVNGLCEVVERKTVECAYDADCGASQWCDQTTWTCQAGTLPERFCGDGVCNGDETASTCNLDCRPKIVDTEGSNLLYILIFASLAILTMIVVKQSRGKRRR